LPNGGLVVFDASLSGSSRAMNIETCVYMKISGTGAGVTYGFEMTGFTNAGLRVSNLSEYIEIENLYIHDDAGGFPAGMRISPLASQGAGFIMNNVFIHDCYIDNVLDEGMYFGHGPTQTQPGRPINNAQIYNCIVTNCDYDGIQVRYTTGDVKVYDNLVEDCGAAAVPPAPGGASGSAFVIGEAAIGRWYNNVMKDCDRGFQLLTHSAGVRVDHNVINNCGYISGDDGGIIVFTSGNGIQIDHNTIITPADYGIQTKGGDTNGIIEDNIIAAPGVVYINSSYSTIRNNLQTATVAQNDFVDAASDDFNLTVTSPARNYAHDSGDAGAFPYEEAPEPPPEIVGIVVVPTPSLNVTPRWESKQLSAHLYKPTIGSYTPRGSLVLDNLANLWTTYRHSKKRVGGYWNAAITQRGRLSEIEDWIFRLGYHFECFNPALDQIWEGFVNRVTLQIGGFTVERGPFLDVVNRGYLVYSTVDTTTDPPVVGVRATSGPTENMTSQERYGIIEKYASAGGVSIDEVNDILAVYVAENATPRTGKRWNNREQSVPTATVELLGYVHFLKLFAFNDTTTGTRTLPEKVQDILGGDPNGLFSTDYSKIDPDGVNAQTIRRYKNENQTAWAQIKSIVAQGDGTNPWTFGIYNGRQAHYDILPSEWKYEQRLLDPGQRIFQYGGAEVAPWDVEPGKLMLATDFLIGKTPLATTPREDERTTLIEQVTFVYPTFMDIVGGQFNTLSQRLATLGLSGIG